MQKCPSFETKPAVLSTAHFIQSTKVTPDYKMRVNTIHFELHVKLQMYSFSFHKNLLGIKARKTKTHLLFHFHQVKTMDFHFKPHSQPCWKSTFVWIVCNSHKYKGKAWSVFLCFEYTICSFSDSIFFLLESPFSMTLLNLSFFCPSWAASNTRFTSNLCWATSMRAVFEASYNKLSAFMCKTERLCLCLIGTAYINAERILCLLSTVYVPNYIHSLIPISLFLFSGLWFDLLWTVTTSRAEKLPVIEGSIFFHGVL